MSGPDLVESERNAEPMEDWWERVHAGDSRLYVAGYDPANVFERLGVADRIAMGRVVLDIGVGFGACVQALAAAGCDTHALDISRTALARVEPYAVTWHTSQLGQLPVKHYDLALSHLVAQHMQGADLSNQFAAVIRALKPSGIFAMQFASPVGEVPPRSRKSAKSGWVLRTPEAIQTYAVWHGGKVIRCWQCQQFSDVLWHTAHIMREGE